MRRQGFTRGSVTTVTNFNKGDLFHIDKMFRNYLAELNVAFYDACCPNTNVDGAFPVRFLTDGLQYFNGVAWTAIAESAQTITALTTNSITSGNAFISVGKAIVEKRTATAVNVTGAITAAQLSGGLITSTSAAAVTATLPTAALLATAIGAVQGTTFDFVVDNSAGANTVTVQVNTGIVAITPVITGGDTLTVASGTVGVFKVIFTSATAALLARVA